MKLTRIASFNTLAFIAASGAAGIVGFAFLPVLTRALTKEEFSAFSKALLVVQFMAAPGAFGLSAYITTLVVRLSEEGDAIRRAFSDWTLLYALLSLAALAVSPFVPVGTAIVLVLAVAYARAWCSLGAQSYRLLQAPGWFSIYQVGVPLAFYMLAIGAHYAIGLSGSALFYVGSVAYGVAAVHTWRQCRRRGWIDNLWRFRFRDPRYLKFAAGSFLHSLAGVGMTSWDRAYVATALSTGEFAIYSVGATYSAGLVLVFTAISQALVPQAYAVIARKPASMSACLGYFLKVGGGFVVIAALYEVAIGPVIHVMVPEAFRGAIPIARKLGLAALLQGLYFLSSAVLFFYHRTMALSMITLTCGSLGALLAIGMGAASSAQIVDIYITMWGLFLVLTTALAILQLRKNA